MFASPTEQRLYLGRGDLAAQGPAEGAPFCSLVHTLRPRHLEVPEAA
ncbi:MAG TPA: hypothetical protein VME20_12415 [Acidimicrobiales bacterium]|nr:hypothetical protein [Acidimicrobiales bacterium]